MKNKKILTKKEKNDLIFHIGDMLCGKGQLVDKKNVRDFIHNICNNLGSVNLTPDEAMLFIFTAISRRRGSFEEAFNSAEEERNDL